VFQSQPPPIYLLRILEHHLQRSTKELTDLTDSTHNEAEANSKVVWGYVTGHWDILAFMTSLADNHRARINPKAISDANAAVAAAGLVEPSANT
jgi:hypothetical protein